MKSKIKRYAAYFLLLITVMIGYSSCVVEDVRFYDDDSISDVYYNRTLHLCDYVWKYKYTNADGLYCEQFVKFFTNRRGEERILVYYPDGEIRGETYSFRWSWEDLSQTAVYVEYGVGDGLFLEDIRLSGNRLMGLWDGQMSTFVGQ